MWTRGRDAPFPPPRGTMERVFLTLSKSGKRKRNLSLIGCHHWTPGQNLHIFIVQMLVTEVGQETSSYEFRFMWYQTIVLPSTWQKQTLIISRGRYFHPRPQELCTNDFSLSVSSHLKTTEHIRKQVTIS